jgi:phosphoribosylanthranilate isomerase
VIVQIYGLTTPEDAALVCALGADHAGFVLDEGIETWDSVDLPAARAIRREIPAPVRAVALSLSCDVSRIARTVEETAPAIVHLARAAEGMSAEAIARLRERIAGVELMITIPVRGREAADLARRAAAYADWLLLDSADPVTGLVGATGRTHDWSISGAIVPAVAVPVILAGGLGPENVVEAIRAVRPAGVDSETRTSRPGERRRKDPDRVRRFVELAREAGRARAS